MKTYADWEKVIPAPIGASKNFIKLDSYVSLRQEEIKRTSSLFRQKIEADLKRLKEKEKYG